MNCPAYPVYKESGVQWLGKVPGHWEMKRFKQLFHCLGGGNPSKGNASFWEGDIPWVSPKDMHEKTISDTEDHISENALIESATQMVPAGATLIVVRSGILRHTLPVATNLVPVALNQDMKALVSNGAIKNVYLTYYIQGHNKSLLDMWTKNGCTVESIESAYMLVNREWTWEDPTINTLLEQATRALGELNAFSLIVPDIDLFIEMHVVKEAQTSSRIEGTQTGIDEALMPEEQIRPEKRDDWREVRNYIEGLNTAVAELKTLPLSNRLLKKTHAVLLQGVRGEHKQPGEFRNSQNWIGGSSLTDATFIPPHQDGVAELMGDLEKFWHNDEVAVPHLIRIAISHYQFETIHPFLDGNGRIGRLLIPLYLVSHSLLAKPSLYLSDFFERNRASYYDALMRVRVSNDLGQWVRFFLNGVAQTATKGREVFRQVLTLRTEVEQAVLGLGKRAQTARLALNLLYRKPIVSALDMEQALTITTPTANKLIKLLIEKGILIEITGQQRGRIYMFDRYLKIFVS